MQSHLVINRLERGARDCPGERKGAHMLTISVGTGEQSSIYMKACAPWWCSCAKAHAFGRAADAGPGSASDQRLCAIANMERSLRDF